MVGDGGFEPPKLKSSRFTVCPLWPLGKSPKNKNIIIASSKRATPKSMTEPHWSWWTDSNPRPADYKSAALPTELHQHNKEAVASKAGGRGDRT